MTSKSLIKNVEVNGVLSDIAIENELITAIGINLKGDGATEYDFTGSIALPGLVDLHTHLREPGKEDAETVLSGSQAAARGGFTAVSAMANTSPVASDLDKAQDLLMYSQLVQ